MYASGFHDKVGDIIKIHGTDPNEKSVWLVSEYLTKEGYSIEDLESPHIKQYATSLYYFAEWVIQQQFLG